MKIKLDKDARIPTRAHSTDAGLDLYARDTQIIPATESAVFDTGVHVELPEGTAGLLKSKSGLNTKHGITSEGVIDVGYTGSIVAKLYNHSGLDYKVKAGDKHWKKQNAGTTDLGARGNEPSQTKQDRV